MAADSPQAALDRFVRPFRQALACLTDASIADERPANRRAALLFPAANANRGYIRLASQHSRVKTPHCHVRGLTGPLTLSKAHFPTGRISIAEIVRFAITELGVPPRYPHGDWQARLDQTAAAFFAQRRW